MITGPQSPSVLSNMPVSIEQHVEFIARIIGDLRTAALERIEPTAQAEDAWVAHNQELAEATLFPTADTWYMGANIPGKPRVFMPYLGRVGPTARSATRSPRPVSKDFSSPAARTRKAPWHDRQPVLLA